MIRFISFIAISAIMFVSCEGKGNMQDITLENQLIGLQNAHNARQLGGYRIGNRTIREDKLIRSAKLSGLSEADSVLLSDKYNVQCIYDFRGSHEIASEPDVIPANASHNSLSIPFSGDGSQSKMKFENQGDIIRMLLEHAEHPAIQHMCTNLYEIIFFGESSQEVYRKFFAHLVTVDPDKGAVLWHCNQGKDRAGCASAMLLAALGADRKLIMEDYTLSKKYYDPMTMHVKTQTDAQKNVIATLISANPVIFEAALDKIDEKYGSFCNYLTECIGVTEEMMQTLREKYLK